MITSMNNKRPVNLYESPFSEISLEADRKLLIVSWRMESEKLNVDETKKEIRKILEYIDKNSIQNIIVDSTEYFFTENTELQTWINYRFMPLIMETQVKKYGFVVRVMTKKYEALNKDYDDDELKIAYFSNLGDAYKWIDE